MNTSQQVGTVDILSHRVYALDPNADTQGTQVSVEPGTYPVYRDVDTYYWVMTGRINGRGAYKIGDGLYELNTSDSGRGPTVTFPSRTFGAGEFRELLDDPICGEGPARWLKFTLTEEIAV